MFGNAQVNAMAVPGRLARADQKYKLIPATRPTAVSNVFRIPRTMAPPILTGQRAVLARGGFWRLKPKSPFSITVPAANRAHYTRTDIEQIWTSPDEVNCRASAMGGTPVVRKVVADLCLPSDVDEGCARGMVGPGCGGPALDSDSFVITNNCGIAWSIGSLVGIR